MTNTYGYIGTRAGSVSSATVTGSGSSWSNANSLAVGYSGNGTLRVLDGGSVTNAGGYVGYDVGSTGLAVVSGTGSLWANSGLLYVGDRGNGTLTVSEGGVAGVDGGAGTLTVANQSGSTGVVNIGSPDLLNPTTAGSLDVASIAFGSGTGVINFNQTDDILFAKPMSGKGRIVQRGSGTTTLTGAVSFTTSAPFDGVTTIKQGTLVVDGAGASISHPSGGFFVGDLDGDDGTLQVKNGGQISSAHSYVGLRAGSGRHG